MATSRDFVYDEQGEMLPSDSAAAAARRKELDDDARMVSDAKDAAKAPVKAPVAAKAKPAVVTKEELAKSGLSLRDYMNKQRGLTRRDGAAPKSKTTSPAVSSSYRSEGAGRAKPPASSGSASSTTPAAPEKRPGTALPINPGILKQREADEKKRDAARAAKRKAEEDEKKARPAKEAAERKMLSEQPGAVAYRKKREEEDKMSPGQRSAARGKKIKEFFGMAKGGSVSSASKRADGIAQRGKTRGKVY